jgi:hypothetical protein
MLVNLGLCGAGTTLGAVGLPACSVCCADKPRPDDKSALADDRCCAVPCYAAIGTALAGFPSLRRQDMKMIAVLSVPLGEPTGAAAPTALKLDSVGDAGTAGEGVARTCVRTYSLLVPLAPLPTGVDEENGIDHHKN